MGKLITPTFAPQIYQDFRKRLDRQSRAFYNLFRQADRVEKLAEIIERLVSISYKILQIVLPSLVPSRLLP